MASTAAVHAGHSGELYRPTSSDSRFGERWMNSQRSTQCATHTADSVESFDSICSHWLRSRHSYLWKRPLESLRVVNGAKWPLSVGDFVQDSWSNKQHVLSSSCCCWKNKISTHESVGSWVWAWCTSHSIIPMILYRLTRRADRSRGNVPKIFQGFSNRIDLMNRSLLTKSLRNRTVWMF